ARAIDRHIELVFAGIDAGADYAMLAHLRRPFLVMRTYSSFNHPGPMKKPTAILLRRQPERLRMGTIRRSAVRPGRPPGPDRSSRNSPFNRIALIQGWVERIRSRSTEIGSRDTHHLARGAAVDGYRASISRKRAIDALHPPYSPR